MARNIGWLVFAEGFPKAASPLANILLARFLGSASYGVLALAQTWAVYASMSADLGVSVYGQAEAARAIGSDELAKLGGEIVPFRIAAGLMTFVVFVVVTSWSPVPGPRGAFLVAGFYILAVAASTDWLFRGRERFDLVLLANSAGMVCLLLGVVLIGKRKDALLLDLTCWALTSYVLAMAYLGLLHQVTGIRLRLRFAPGCWILHLRKSVFVFLSAVLLNSYRFLPLVLLGWLKSPQEVGIFAAPYRLITNIQSIALLLPAAFYPVGASLFRDSLDQFNQSRRSVAQYMLMAGLPVGVIGCGVAGPTMKVVFGHDFVDSGLVFAFIVWLVPLYLIRSIHATTIMSTGFYRIQFIAPACGLAVALVSGTLMIPAWGTIGACVSQLLGEMSMVVANVLISRKVHGDVALPTLPDLSKLLALNLLLAGAAVYLPERVGWIAFLVIASLCYSAGLVATGLINPSRAIAWGLQPPRGLRSVKNHPKVPTFIL